VKSEGGSLRCGLKTLSVTDERLDRFDVVFLPEFAEKDLGQGSRARQKIRA